MLGKLRSKISILRQSWFSPEIRGHHGRRSHTRCSGACALPLTSSSGMQRQHAEVSRSLQVLCRRASQASSYIQSWRQSPSSAHQHQVTTPFEQARSSFCWSFPSSSVSGKSAYKLDLPATMRIHDVFHVCLLERYHVDERPNRLNIQVPAPDVDEQGIQHYVVDAIVNSRLSHGSVEYLVHWKGYDFSENSWVPCTEFLPDDEVVLTFHRKHPRKPMTEAVHQVMQSSLQSSKFKLWVASRMVSDIPQTSEVFPAAHSMRISGASSLRDSKAMRSPPHKPTRCFRSRAWLLETFPGLRGSLAGPLSYQAARQHHFSLSLSHSSSFHSSA